MPSIKKQSKLKKIVSAFNPKSFRGGMALFALLFAVTGGGYMLYRSFAATTYTHILVNKAGKIYSGSGASWTQTDSNGGLPNTIIWRLKRYVSANVFSVFPAGTYFVNSSPIKAKICVKYRFTDKSKNNLIRFLPASDVKKVYPAADGSTTYQTLCSLPTTVNRSDATATVRVYNEGKYNTSTGIRPGEMYIQNISLRW